MTDIAKDISVMKDIEDLTGYVYELEEYIKNNLTIIRIDLNKVIKAYLDCWQKTSEDHEMIRSYLKQNKDFQKWTATQVLKQR